VATVQRSGETGRHDISTSLSEMNSPSRSNVPRIDELFPPDWRCRGLPASGWMAAKNDCPSQRMPRTWEGLMTARLMIVSLARRDDHLHDPVLQPLGPCRALRLVVRHRGDDQIELGAAVFPDPVPAAKSSSRIVVIGIQERNFN